MEGWQIIWVATSDNSLINHHLLIHPFCTSVLEVRFDGRERGHLFAIDQFGFDQRPGTVAYGRGGLALLTKILNERYRIFFYPYVRVNG